MLYNPNKKGALSDGVGRIPMASFAHELSHAYDVNNGLLHNHHLYVDWEHNESYWRTREVPAGNIENEFRSWMHFDQRRKYGNVWVLRQF